MMNATLINKEKTEVKFSFEVSPEGLETGLAFAYNKNKNQISIPGFRKGKVPRKVIEAQYGEGFFYEEAINHIFPDEYMEAIKALDLDVVSKPTLDVEYINKEQGIKFLIDVTVKPEVTLGQYKGLSVEKVPAEVTEEDIQAELKKVQNQNARSFEVTDRPAQMGDVVKIAYEGSVDGVAFDGGKADDHDLELGSHAFIEGFEEQIVGHSIGEKFDIHVTFPEVYHSADLAGKAAVFAIDLKGITGKELPEINDAFAEDVSEFSTLDEYKASIAGKLAEQKTEHARQLQGDKLLDAAVANCTMEVPQVMYDNKIDSMMEEFAQNITQQGLTMDLYYQYMGTSEADMRAHFKDTCIKSVDARLMLEAIAKAENLSISKEDLDAEIIKYGESYGLDGKLTLEMFQEDNRKALEADMLVKAAMKLIEETAVLTEPAK